MKYENQNVFLVGMMGAGKSTVGKVLAQRLGKTYIDADHELETRTGVKIPVIFELEGEAGFRKREAELIDHLTQRSNIVLATGGGAVMDTASRSHLKARGFTIYISSTAQELWQRTRKDRNRPMLQTRDPLRKLQELLILREPLYREVADMVIETGRPSVSKLIGEILQELAVRPECAVLVSGLASTTPSTTEAANDATQNIVPNTISNEHV
jgi:shikimate kinase